MGTHTPRPWEIFKRPDGGIGVRHSATGNHPVCDVFYMNSTGEANASLIAAAPDLLAALKQCDIVMDTAAIHGLPQNLPDAYRESWAAAHTQARKLLAGL